MEIYAVQISKLHVASLNEGGGGLPALPCLNFKRKRHTDVPCTGTQAAYAGVNEYYGHTMLELPQGVLWTEITATRTPSTVDFISSDV